MSFIAMLEAFRCRLGAFKLPSLIVWLVGKPVYEFLPEIINYSVSVSVYMYKQRFVRSQMGGGSSRVQQYRPSVGLS